MSEQTEVVDSNPNTAWIHNRAFPWAYAFLVASTFAIARTLVPTPLAATLVLQCHAIATFILLHWVKGAPDGGALQEHIAHLTFWEQIDDGFVGTPDRKFLTIVPVVLYFSALLANRDALVPLALNTLSTIVVLIPKHESLFGVRIAGVNKLD